MKTVTLKKTVDISLNETLSSFVLRNYDQADSASLSTTLETIDACRKDVVAVLQDPASPLEQTLKALQLWLSYIVILEDHLPFGNFQGGIDVEFQWTCSFNPKAKVSLPSIHFEKLSVLFNLAVVYSRLADSRNGSSPDPVKEAVNQLQTAASVFVLVKALSANTSTGKETADLSEAGLAMYIALMSAQAQTCAYEKAVKDKFNRSLLSKLANQVANFYASALSASRSVHDLPSSLTAWFTIQQMAFQSVAHYQRAMFDLIEVERRSEGYGSVISRMRHAATIRTTAIQRAAETGLTIDLTVLEQAIHEVLQKLERDNRTVYLEVVVAESVLPPLEAVSAIPLKDPVTLQSLCTELPSSVLESFTSIFPVHVQPHIKELDIRTGALLNPVKESIAQLETEVETFYSEHLLPFIVADELTGLLPERLWQTIREAQTLGGVDAVLDLIIAMGISTESSKVSIDLLQRKLEQDNTLLKNRQGGQTHHTYWQSIEKYKDKWTLAVQANQAVREALDPAMRWKDTLSQSRKQIEEFFQRNTDEQENTEKRCQAKQEVRSVLDSLASSVVEIQPELRKLEELVRHSRGRLHRSIMKSGKSDPSVVSLLINKEIDHFKNTIQSVILQRGKCIAFLEKAMVTWKQQQAAIMTVKEQERVHTLKSLEAAACAVIQVHENAREGLQFFERLSQLIKTLSDQIDDWRLSSKEHRLETSHQRLYSDSSHSLLRPVASSSFSSTPSAVPPHSYFHPPIHAITDSGSQQFQQFGPLARMYPEPQRYPEVLPSAYYTPLVPSNHRIASHSNSSTNYHYYPHYWTGPTQQ